MRVLNAIVTSCKVFGMYWHLPLYAKAKNLAMTSPGSQEEASKPGAVLKAAKNLGTKRPKNTAHLPMQKRLKMRSNKSSV
jgi:hypothetical protein